MLGFCSASGRCFPSSSTVSGRGPRSSCAVIMRQSSRGVAVQASSTGQKGMEGTVEMYVADGTLDWEAGQLIESPRRKVKTPPRVDGETVPERPRLSATPVRVGEALASSEDPVVIKQTYRTERVELAMKSSELQAARLELAEARALIREKEAEMAKMKKLLVQRDVHVTRVKAELIETQLQLQQKEAKLEEAYQALTEAAHERTELRRMLVEAEQNLAVTRSELMRWSDGMAELKMVMDELQDDDWSPQWPSENGAGLNGNGAGAASSSAVNGNGAGPLQEEEEQAMDEALLSVLQELKALSSAAVQDADTDELMWSNSSYLSDR